MGRPPDRFDAESVRQAWDHAADAYAQGQASGRDYYRYEFLGPAQVALCGDVNGKRLLDVGCGSGYFAREMAERGAEVTAIDISSRMIEHAREAETAARRPIDFVVLDAADIPSRFGPQSFDVVTACLSLQDMPAPAAVIRGIHAVIRPEGRLVASITHPCSDLPFRTWHRDDSGRKLHLCIDRYFERTPMEYEWQGWPYRFVTPSIHATLEDWFAWFLGAGFQVRQLREPRPTAEAVADRPDLDDAARIPYYLLFDLTKPRA
jgi:ubiquinone/menaquinone biosynthesis C-methylase UbiE